MNIDNINFKTYLSISSIYFSYYNIVNTYNIHNLLKTSNRSLQFIYNSVASSQ
jgi:hypothetical protein